MNTFRALSIGNDLKLLSNESFEGISENTQTPSNALSKGKAKAENLMPSGGVWVGKGGPNSDDKKPAKAGESAPEGAKQLAIGAPPSSETGGTFASGWAAWSTVPSNRSRQANPAGASAVVASRRNTNFAKIRVSPSHQTLVSCWYLLVDID